jgi:hypothetical protein
MQDTVQDMAVDNVYTSPTGEKNETNTEGLERDATLPVPTHLLMLAV